MVVFLDPRLSRCFNGLDDTIFPDQGFFASKKAEFSKTKSAVSFAGSTCSSVRV